MSTPIIVITTDQLVPLSIEPLSFLGNDSTINGAPLWASSSVSSVSLSVANGGLTATAIGSSVGVSTISVLGNANMATTGVAIPVSGSLIVQVVAAQANSIEILTGSPVLQ